MCVRFTQHDVHHHHPLINFEAFFFPRSTKRTYLFVIKWKDRINSLEALVRSKSQSYGWYIRHLKRTVCNHISEDLFNEITRIKQVLDNLKRNHKFTHLAM